MPNSQSVRRILLALAGLIAMLGTSVATARAEYGELGSPVVLTGKVEESSLKPHVFGVDPAEHSFYVGDEITKVEGATESHFYRIQKFSSTGEPLAEAQIKAIPSSVNLGNLALEGIAVYPAEKRLYVLVDREREPEPEEPGEEPVFDPGKPAASNLYTFSTEVKNSNHELELLKSVNLKPQSEEPKVALLEPHGIAVDPTDGDVVIVGQEDEQTVKGEEPELRAAVQFVAPNGTMGARYVDLSNCLDEGNTSGGEPACGEGSSPDTEPFSPIVSPSGKVFVERGGEIWEIPPTKEENPKRFETLPKHLLPIEEPEHKEPGFELELPEQALVEFPKAGEGFAEEVGGTMSFVSEGGTGEGKIYLTGGIAAKAGALILGYAEPGAVAEARELGWTGGQSESSCSLPKKGNEALLIGGGEKEDLFVFDAHQGLGSSPAGVDLFEFGPGGTGCPHAGVTEPSVKVKNSHGEEVEVSPVPLGETTTLSSEVSEGNAKRVEWKFNDLTTKEEETPTESGYEFQTTSIEHKFEHTGEYEVTEIVETDDLASPKIEAKREVKVAATPLSVEFSYPVPVNVGKAVKFEASVHDPHETGGTPHLKYVWKFGDGEEKSGETTSTAFSVEHTYMAEAEASVTLEVTDAHGVSGEVTRVVSVAQEAKEPAKEPTKEPAKEPAKEPVKETPKVEGSPEVTLPSTSLSVNSAGAVTLKVTCPAGDSSCAGTVTLRTLEAVAARTAGHRGKGKHKAVLTLATGSFTVAGGQAEAVTLHLSTAARTLLARMHVLRAQATLVAHNAAGATHTTQTTVTLRAAAKAKRHHKR